AVSLLALAAGVAWLGWRAAGPNRLGGGGARWASRRDLRAIRGHRTARSRRLILGRARGWPGTPNPGAPGAAPPGLVLGPTQSGQRSGLAVPALLEWSGPAIATSVKDDLAAASLGWRRGRGPCWIFDPTCTSGLRPLASWTPLAGCADWSAAQRMA